jgi:hypothetical protein
MPARERGPKQVPSLEKPVLLRQPLVLQLNRKTAREDRDLLALLGQKKGLFSYYLVRLAVSLEPDQK